MTDDNARKQAQYGWRADLRPPAPAMPRRLRGEDRRAADALRMALESATAKTSGLAPVSLTREEGEAALRTLWRAGWKVTQR